MSEQAKILAQMYELIGNILKTGQASEEEGRRIDELEALLHEQKCFSQASSDAYECLGEEIANLFVQGSYDEAITLLTSNAISAEDFFGFAQYHFDEEDDEEIIDHFTHAFMVGVKKDLEAK